MSIESNLIPNAIVSSGQAKTNLTISCETRSLVGIKQLKKHLNHRKLARTIELRMLN